MHFTSLFQLPEVNCPPFPLQCSLQSDSDCLPSDLANWETTSVSWHSHRWIDWALSFLPIQSYHQMNFSSGSSRFAHSVLVCSLPVRHLYSNKETCKNTFFCTYPSSFPVFFPSCITSAQILSLRYLPRCALPVFLFSHRSCICFMYQHFDNVHQRDSEEENGNRNGVCGSLNWARSCKAIPFTEPFKRLDHLYTSLMLKGSYYEQKLTFSAFNMSFCITGMSTNKQSAKNDIWLCPCPCRSDFTQLSALQSELIITAKPPQTFSLMLLRSHCMSASNHLLC